MIENLRDLHGETALRRLRRAFHKQHNIAALDLFFDPIVNSVRHFSSFHPAVKAPTIMQKCNE
jgi:hypothetical protein